jgi:hypothetical protein
LQRADVHDVDEPGVYAALMQLQPDTYTVERSPKKSGAPRNTNTLGCA